MTDGPAQTPRFVPPAHLCDGCGHITLHALLSAVLDELDLKSRAVGVSSIGCSFLVYDFLDVDFLSAPPGKAPAIATGIKRSLPEAPVFTYQGDGDALGSGLGELLGAISRDEKITILVVNNATQSLSGGHTSPTTLPGQRSRMDPGPGTPDPSRPGLDIIRLAGALGTGARLARASLDSDRNIARARQALRDAFQHPLTGGGTALVEVLSACPTYWGLTVDDSRDFMKDALARAYPPGPRKVKSGTPD